MEVTYKEFQEALKTVDNYKKQLESHYKIIQEEYSRVGRFVRVTKDTEFMDIDNIEIRTLNCLGYLGLSKVKDLEKVTIRELKQVRNFGKKSLDEVKEICFYAGVTLLP